MAGGGAGRRSDLPRHPAGVARARGAGAAAGLLRNARAERHRRHRPRHAGRGGDDRARRAGGAAGRGISPHQAPAAHYTRTHCAGPSGRQGADRAGVFGATGRWQDLLRGQSRALHGYGARYRGAAGRCRFRQARRAGAPGSRRTAGLARRAGRQPDRCRESRHPHRYRRPVDPACGDEDGDGYRAARLSAYADGAVAPARRQSAPHRDLRFAARAGRLARGGAGDAGRAGHAGRASRQDA